MHRGLSLDKAVRAKPTSIALSSDFGLARWDGVKGESEDDASPAGASPLGQPLTRAGVLMGTPDYMAPEQQRGEVTDARSDQFSFCACTRRAVS